MDVNNRTLTNMDVAERLDSLSKLCLIAMRRHIALLPHHVVAGYPDASYARHSLAVMGKDVRLMTATTPHAVIDEVKQYHNLIFEPLSTKIIGARILRGLFGGYACEVLTDTALVCWYNMQPTEFSSHDYALRNEHTDILHREMAEFMYTCHIVLFTVRGFVLSAPVDRRTSDEATIMPMEVAAAISRKMEQMEGGMTNWDRPVFAVSLDIEREREEMIRANIR